MGDPNKITGQDAGASSVPSGDVWSTPTAPLCHGSCHSPAPSKSPSNFFMADLVKKPFGLANPSFKNPYTPSFEIQKWLDANAPKTDPKPLWQPPTPSPVAVLPKKPIEKDAKALEEAQKLEKEAQGIADPQKKIPLLREAFLNYQVVDDKPSILRVLALLKEQYRKTDQPVLVSYVEADLALHEGKHEEALAKFKAFEVLIRNLDLSEAERFGTLSEINLKISQTLQALGAQAVDRQDYSAAFQHYREALKRTPSDHLAGQVLALYQVLGHGNLKAKAARIHSLEEDIRRANVSTIPCNANCHRSSSDLAYGPFTKPRPYPGIFPPSPNDPDLSAYDSLVHLSREQKLLLYDEEQELSRLKVELEKDRKFVQDTLAVYRGPETLEDVDDLEKKLTTAADFNPASSVARQLLGQFLLGQGKCAKAVEAFEAAGKGNAGDFLLQIDLGRASFGAGDLKKARAAYAACLAQNSRNETALLLRGEVNQAALEKLTDPKETAELRAELQADQGMLLALGVAEEKKKIETIEKGLAAFHDSPLADKKEKIELLLLMANQYLTLGGASGTNTRDAEFVRGALSGLGSETYAVLKRFAEADSDPAIKKMIPVFEAYGFLAQGKMDEAVPLLKKIRQEGYEELGKGNADEGKKRLDEQLKQAEDLTAKGKKEEAEKILGPLPAGLVEAHRILGAMDRDKLRLVNLAAVEAWETYNQEGKTIQTDNASGVLGIVVGTIDMYARDDNGTLIGDIARKWATEKEMVAEVKRLITEGKADTIYDALGILQESAKDDAVRFAAAFHYSQSDMACKGRPLPQLIAYTAQIPPNPKIAENLLGRTFELEADNGAVNAPFAIYSLVNSLNPDVGFNGTPKEHMEALQGNSSFGRSFMKFIYSTSPEEVALTVGTMFVAGGAGALARLGTLAKLEEAGVTGYRALALARGAGLLAETSVLWGLSIGQEALLKDPKKVFTQEHLLKSYGATLLMIGGLKSFGALGRSWGPRAARALGMVEEGALTSGGKVLVWGFGHGMGLSGMVATTKINQAIGLKEGAVGGWKESLANDVLGYVQFAVAHKMVDGVFSGKLSTVSQKQHTAIAVKEATLLAKGYADRLGFKAESPSRKAVIDLFTYARLTQAGFSGEKLVRFIEGKEYDRANEYLAKMEMPLAVDPEGRFVLRIPTGPSLHEKMGVLSTGDSQEALKFKIKGNPSQKTSPSLLDRVVARIGQRAQKVFQKILNVADSNGGLEVAFASAGDGISRAAPGRRGNSVQGIFVAEMKSLEPFETALMEEDIYGIRNNHALSPKDVTVMVELERPEQAKTLAEALPKLPPEVKRLEVEAKGSLPPSDLLALVALGRSKGIEIVIGETDPAKGLEPRFRIFSGRILVREASEGIDLLVEAVRAGKDLDVGNLQNKNVGQVKGDRVMLEFKLSGNGEKFEALQKLAVAAIKAKRSLTIESKGETVTIQPRGDGILVKTGGGESLDYSPAKGGTVSTKARLSLNLPPGGQAERMSFLIRLAAELDPTQLKDAIVDVKGVNFQMNGGIRSSLALLARKSLFSGCARLEVGPDLLIERLSNGKKLQYDFSTSLPLQQLQPLFAEYLAFESAAAFRVTGLADPDLEGLVNFWKGALQQAVQLEANASSPQKAAEFEPYVKNMPGSRWSQMWRSGAAEMIEFSKNSAQQAQLRSVFERIRLFSQREAGHFLNFKPFDGRPFDDNAFELVRIFEKGGQIPGLQLSPILKDIQETMGSFGKVEIYGATVGIVFKARIPEGFNGKARYNHAAINEFDRLLEMKTEALRSGDPYRIHVIPEDRLQGSNNGTNGFTKTPEWILEKVEADGSVKRMLSVETKNNDGGLFNPNDAKKMVETAVWQLTGHKFNSSVRNESLMIVKFYNVSGNHQALIQMVQEAMAAEYAARLRLQNSRNPEHQGKADSMRWIRVKIIFENGVAPETSWLEFDKKSEWVPRSTKKGQIFHPGTQWEVPTPQAVGWN